MMTNETMARSKEDFDKFIKRSYVAMYNENNLTASFIQRKLGRGRDACNSILKDLEELGRISKQEGAKKRKFLVCPGCFMKDCECGKTVYQSSHDYHHG